MQSDPFIITSKGQKTLIIKPRSLHPRHKELVIFDATLERVARSDAAAKASAILAAPFTFGEKTFKQIELFASYVEPTLADDDEVNEAEASTSPVAILPPIGDVLEFLRPSNSRPLIIRNLAGDIMPLPPGLTMLNVKTRGGKSTMLEKLRVAAAEGSFDHWFLYVDEHAPNGGSPFLGPQDAFSAPFDSLSNDVRLPRMIIVDSLRLLPFSLPGGLRSGAVAASFFGYLTDLDAIAAKFGVSLVAAFNPMIADTSSSTLLSDIESSVTTVCHLTNFVQLTYSSRVSLSGPVDRSGRSLTVDSFRLVEFESSTPSPTETISTVTTTSAFLPDLPRPLSSLADIEYPY